MERSYDHYEIQNELGAGKLGRVYLAEDTKLGRQVAFKIINEDALGGRRDMKRCFHDARVVGEINHPNIADVYGVGRTDSSFYVASEFVEGKTLRDRMNRGKLDMAEALGIAVQIATALREAHRRGIVHRDIKPENVMILGDGSVKVMDFGLARLNGRSAKRGGLGTLIGAEDQTVQTISYLAPEELRGYSIDRRSDIWSFGALLYEMTSGHTPFDAKTTATMEYSVLKNDPLPLEEGPVEFQHIVEKALNKSRRRRYQNAESMAADLETCLDVVSGRTPRLEFQTDPPTLMDRLRRIGSRRLSRTAGSEATIGAEPVHGSEAIEWFDPGQESSDEAPILHANLWVEDDQQQPISPPVRLQVNQIYLLLFAIERQMRESVSSTRVFVEPDELQKAPVTDVEIEVISRLLANGKGSQVKAAKYYAGQGFPPVSFDLKAERPDSFPLTVRLYCQNVILYREELTCEVATDSVPSSDPQPQALSALS